MRLSWAEMARVAYNAQETARAQLGPAEAPYVGTSLTITGAFQTSGSNVAGSNTINITAATTLTGTAIAGSQLVIAGVLYTVTANAAAAGNVIALPVTPAVPVTIPAATAITSPWPLPGLTLTTGSLVLAAGAVVGATSLVASATAVTGSVSTGQRFAVMGVTYTVTGAANAAGNSITIPVSPAVPFAIPAGTVVEVHASHAGTPGADWDSLSFVQQDYFAQLAKTRAHTVARPGAAGGYHSAVNLVAATDVHGQCQAVFNSVVDSLR